TRGNTSAPALKPRAKPKSTRGRIALPGVDLRDRLPCASAHQGVPRSAARSLHSSRKVRASSLKKGKESSLARISAGLGTQVNEAQTTPTPSCFASHLAPCPSTSSGRERKGAKRSGRRFLSPVERGRGGREAVGVGVDAEAINPSSEPCGCRRRWITAP